MLPAGRPSLGLGSSESAVSTEPKNAPLNLCIEAYRELERQTSQWSCVERGDNKTRCTLVCSVVTECNE